MAVCDELNVDTFSFRISKARPFSRFSIGTLVGGQLPDGAKDDDWERFEDEQRAKLDTSLKNYRRRTLECGASCEMTIPDELDQKLAVAAIYAFCKKSPAEIGALSAVTRDRTVVHRWLHEILPLLDLPLTRRQRQATAHPAKKPQRTTRKGVFSKSTGASSLGRALKSINHSHRKRPHPPAE